MARSKRSSAPISRVPAMKEVPQRWNDGRSRTDEVLVALLDAQRFLSAPAAEPFELVDDLLDVLGRYEAIPGLIFERRA